MADVSGYYAFPGPWAAGVPSGFPFIVTRETPRTLSTQVVEQEGATAQSMQGYSSLGQFGQVGAAGESWLTADTISNIAVAQNALRALGLAGPTYGLTPINMALNAQYAQLVNATASQLSQSSISLAMIRAGAAAILAQSGRKFLGATYSTEV